MLLRLQQILFHRELGFSLAEIGAIVDRPGFERIAALEGHRLKLEAEAERYRRLIATIDRTIAELSKHAERGEWTMKHAELYQGFSSEKQAEYEEWLVERYGGDMRSRIELGKRKFADLGEAERDEVMAELADVEAALAEACRRGLPPDSSALEPALERHRAWVAHMWDRPCPAQAYAGLADLYLAHPDFRARYETLQTGFCDYLVTAMRAHAKRLDEPAAS